MNTTTNTTTLSAVDHAGFRFTCPACDQHLRCTEDDRGTPIQCPTCAAHIRIPNNTGLATLMLHHDLLRFQPNQALPPGNPSLPSTKPIQPPSRPDLQPYNPTKTPATPGHLVLSPTIGDKSLPQNKGAKNILYGAVWCVGGIVVTAATYAAAEPGGTFIIAWGAILFGGIQFLGGLFESVKDGAGV